MDFEKLGNSEQRLANIVRQAEEAGTGRFPDFMVISPGKTGTTWLFKNLNRHPGIFIPEAKEIKYFCGLYKTRDLRWYLGHFEGKETFVKGEISPTYALLPRDTIKTIKALKPDLKLIFLARDPVNRAWSHAKHNYRYREGGFSGFDGDFEEISDAKFIENFTHEFPFSFGDYQGIINRWLSFFPRENLFIGFYEQIINGPMELLCDIFRHLGLDVDINRKEFPTAEVVLEGLPYLAPERLMKYLRSLYRNKTLKFAAYLKETFDIETPAQWKNTMTGDEMDEPFTVEKGRKGYSIFAFKGKFYAAPDGTSDANVAKLLLSRELIEADSLFEAKFKVDGFFEKPQGEFEHYYLTYLLDKYVEVEAPSVSTPRLLEAHKAYNLIRYADRIYAIAQSLGSFDLTRTPEEKIDEFRENGACFIGNSVEEVKALIDSVIATS